MSFRRPSRHPNHHFFIFAAASAAAAALAHHGQGAEAPIAAAAAAKIENKLIVASGSGVKSPREIRVVRDMRLCAR